MTSPRVGDSLLPVLLPDLETVVASSIEDRRDLARALFGQLPGEWRMLDSLVGALGLPAAEHAPTGRTFVLVPGGAFDMGFSDSDRDALAELVDWTSEVSDHVGRLERLARPVHRVTVAPFLCDRRTLRRADVVRLSGDPSALEMMSRARALSLVSSLGFRLPSEAELEYLARGGRDLAFVDDGAHVWETTKRWPDVGPLGVEDLSLGEWAADDFHRSYEGAPTSSAPWMSGEACGVFRGELPIGPDQSRSELVFGLAAHRNRGARPDDRGSDHASFNVRLAMSIDVSTL